MDDNNTEIPLDDINCMGQDYSNNGFCPCCGGYTRTIGGNYDGETQYEECEDCDWKGAVDYD